MYGLALEIYIYKQLSDISTQPTKLADPMVPSI